MRAYKDTEKRLSTFIKALILSAVLLWAAVPLSYIGAIPRIGFLNPKAIPANAAALQYGLIGENAILLDNDYQPITGLPATYFVIIIEETGEFFHVQYSDLSGFIQKNKIVPIDYEPKLVFGTAYFIADNDTHPVNVRTSPQSGATVEATISDGESAFYYGSISGDALISGAGNLWYYVRLNGGTHGYVYSAQGTAGVFAVNSGERVEPPSQNDGGEGGGGGNGLSFPDWGFILLLAIPAVIITLALFARKPSKKEQSRR